MEANGEISAAAAAVPMGIKQSKLKRSFKLALYRLLTACSKEDICNAFPGFGNDEQKLLHQLFIKVITSLHGNIEDAFESLCDEMKVGTSLDTIEQLIEEQTLDVLSSDKVNVLDTVEDFTATNKAEIENLQNALKQIEEDNRAVRARIDSLKKDRQDLSAIANAVEKIGR